MLTNLYISDRQQSCYTILHSTWHVVFYKRSYNITSLKLFSLNVQKPGQAEPKHLLQLWIQTAQRRRLKQDDLACNGANQSLHQVCKR